MSKQQTRYFTCNQKYGNVIRILEERGWVLVEKDEDNNKNKEPTHKCETSLIWDNLSAIHFPSVSVARKYVNHIKGFHHLSNKSYLAYHLTMQGACSIIPPTWSSAFQSVLELLHMISIETTICLLDSAISVFGNDNHNSCVMWDNDKQLQLQCLKEVYSILEGAIHFTADPIFGHAIVALTSTLMGDGNSVTATDSNLKAIRSQLAKLQDREFRDVFSTTPMVDCVIDSNTLSDHSARDSRRAWRGNHNLWIIKPSGESNGRNIVVARGILDVFRAVENLQFRCVVQKYIEHPMLVSPRYATSRVKFDIRQWVLVTSVNPLVIYGFSECYARLASDAFSLDDTSLDNAFVHLCNHSIQKKNENPDAAISTCNANAVTEDVTAVTSKDMLMLSQDELDVCLRDYFSEKCGHTEDVTGRLEHPFYSLILPQIKAHSIRCISAASDRLDQSCGRGRGFEWLGLDFIIAVDDNLNSVEPQLDVLLLEVNISPDTTPSTSVTSRLTEAAISHLFDIVLNEHRDENASTTAQWNMWYTGKNIPSAEISAMSDSKSSYRHLRMKGENLSEEEISTLEVCKARLHTIGLDFDSDEI